MARSPIRLAFPRLICWLLASTALAPVAGADPADSGTILGRAATARLGRLLRVDDTLEPTQGYVGIVDASGRDMTTGPNGTPRFVRSPRSGAGPMRIASVNDACSSSIDDSEVLALVTDASGRVYAGGTFSRTIYGPYGPTPSVSGAPGNYIARWNGTTWDSLVTPNGLHGPVNALAIDGSGNLYASELTGLASSDVEKWNGTSWSILGSSGMNGTIRALAVDAAGNVYAGGQFTDAGGVAVSNVARWNGTSWSALGTGTTGTVYALATDAAGNMYAGGSFGMAGGVQVNGVARWNGSVWSSLGTGIGGVVRSLAVDGGGNLFAGGSFLTAGAVNARHVAKWNGTSWSALGNGVPGNLAMAIDGSGNLLVSDYSIITKWDGTSWTYMGSPMDNEILTVARGPAGSIVVGGNFTSSNSVNVPGVAQWNGSNWSGMGSGISMHFNGAVTSLSRDRAGNVYVGGPLTADESEVDGAALLQSGYWYPVGYSPPPSSAVYAIAGVSPDTVYVGGDSGVATWISAYSSWVNPGPGPCYALALDAGGKPYDGGAFAGGNIARWTGASWSYLGVGVSDTVFALAVDGSGHLYAGGRFTSAGGNPANHVAMWNGSAWSPLGSGLNDVVYALAVDATGQLYAGGAFTGHVARWDGTSWSVVGAGTNDVVRSLAVDGAGDIYAGGSFTSAGGTPASRIAEWNGTVWSAMGTGVPDGSVNALAIDPAGFLYLGGSFTSAGGAIASNSIALAPVAWITGFSPASLTLGSKIEVFGQGLFGASDVRVGGISTSFYQQSDTSMIVTVPLGATTGPIQVFTPCGTSASSASPFVPMGCLTTGLVAWWPAEFNANDISGNGHNGTPGDPALSQAAATFTLPGESGTAFSFDGATENVVVPDSPAFGFTGAMSIEGWIKTTTGAERYVATKHEDSFYLAVGVGGPSTHTLSFWLNGVTPSWVNGVTPIDDGLWHHVTATYDGASVKLYVDARLDASAAYSGAIHTGTSPILIGARYEVPNASTNTNFAGSIDELAIYNRALIPQEISGLAYPGGTGPCGVTGVGEDLHAARALELAPGWPNPASRVMNFEFRLPVAEAVHAEIVDIAGRRVSMPLKGDALSSGLHHFQWDGRSASGERVASGVYFLRLRAGGQAAIQRIVLVR